MRRIIDKELINWKKSFMYRGINQKSLFVEHDREVREREGTATWFWKELYVMKGVQ